MRFLLLDHFYPKFAREWYAAHPELRTATYEEQRASLATSLFGEVPSEVARLRDLGHDATDVIVNDEIAQSTWAREHNLKIGRPAHVGVRLRRGFVPWPTRQLSARWASKVLLAQVKELRPDVVHVQCMDSLEPGLVSELRKHVRMVVGQVAAPISIDRVLEPYDFVVSSLPNFVERFRRAGQESEWLPLAFEPEIARVVGPHERTVPFSFVGSVFPVHRSRLELLTALGGRVPLEIWTDNRSTLRSNPDFRDRLHPAAWGGAMYQVMASSLLTLNIHIDIAENYANNLRLFEATGMGALLVTDRKMNLPDLFEDGTEVVTYSSVPECVERVRYLLDHREEAATIAAAGMRRTHRDHTWRDRMERLVAMVERRL